MKRKALSLILAFAMAVSLFTVGASAAEPTYGDTAGHWAEAAIERWSGYGIIQGSNGKFGPDGQLTCAQLATILARLLKLPAAKDAGFIDNPADAWYFDAINRCAAAGILKGNSDGTVTPNASITRERAMVMLARALGIEPLSRPDLSRYADAAQVSPYAQGYLAALIEAGIVGGVTADRLAPQDNITRAATVTILDRAIKTYADKAGAAVSANGGLVLVVADDVTVSGTIGRLLVPTDNIVVTVSGSKNIGSIAITGNHSTVILDNATADDVTISGVGSKVETKNGSHIKNITLSESASGAVVAAGSGTTIDNVVNSAPGAAVTGSGTVKNIASDTDVTVETRNTEVKNTGRSEITVTDAKGKETTVKPGTSTTVNKESASSGGSSGGSYTPPTHTHTWDAGAVTKEPTCTEPGVKTYTCTTCGATRTESIPALGHAWGAYTVTKHAVNGNNGKKNRTCTSCNTTESAPLLYKFYLGIESGSTVDMTVGEDYTAVFTMPAAGGKVNTGSVTVTAKMQDVASLGVSDERSHSMTLNTDIGGVGGTDVDLDYYLENCYKFDVATINATIDNKSCTYTLGKIDETNSDMYTITAVTDPAAASAAWQALTSHVEATTQGNDSKIIIKNGAYLMIGTEKLEFTNSEVGDLTLDNLNNMSALNTEIRTKVMLTNLSEENDQGSTITAYLPAGTTLAVGSSVATLKDNCTITITLDEDEMSPDGESYLRTTLSSLRDADTASAMVQTLVNAFDELVRVADASGEVAVNITFANETIEP